MPYPILLHIKFQKNQVNHVCRIHTKYKYPSLSCWLECEHFLSSLCIAKFQPKFKFLDIPVTLFSFFIMSDIPDILLCMPNFQVNCLCLQNPEQIQMCIIFMLKQPNGSHFEFPTLTNFIHMARTHI